MVITQATMCIVATFQYEMARELPNNVAKKECKANVSKSIVVAVFHDTTLFSAKLTKVTLL